MNLYLVQDADRPRWVAANSFQGAVRKWTLFVAKESEIAEDEVGTPSGVQLVCEGNEYLP